MKVRAVQEWDTILLILVLFACLESALLSYVFLLYFVVCLYPASNFQLYNASFLRREGIHYWLFLKVLSQVAFQSFCNLKLLIYKVNVGDHTNICFPSTLKHFWLREHVLDDHFWLDAKMIKNWVANSSVSVAPICIHSTINIVLEIKQPIVWPSIPPKWSDLPILYLPVY